MRWPVWPWFGQAEKWFYRRWWESIFDMEAGKSLIGKIISFFFVAWWKSAWGSKYVFKVGEWSFKTGVHLKMRGSVCCCSQQKQHLGNVCHQINIMTGLNYHKGITCCLTCNEAIMTKKLERQFCDWGVAGFHSQSCLSSCLWLGLGYWFKLVRIRMLTIIIRVIGI